MHSTRTHVELTKSRAVRYLPDWLPGTGFKALAKGVREKYKISIEGPMEYVKDAMKVGPQSIPGSDRD